MAQNNAAPTAEHPKTALESRAVLDAAIRLLQRASRTSDNRLHAIAQDMMQQAEGTGVKSGGAS